MAAFLRKFWGAALLAIAVAASAAPAVAQTEVAATGKTVSTGATGQQILFRDKTSISAGANSTVTVTRANYDAATGAANVAIEVTKGAFRYVTGDTAGKHSVKTPLATVGVRGTVIEGYVDIRGYEVFALLEGAFEVCSAVMCQVVDKPGTFVIVSPNGQITPPAPIPPSLITAMLISTPSVDLVLEYISDLLNTGGDPLVRFRDLNDSLNGNKPLPPAPPPEPPPPPPECEECSYSKRLR